MNKVIIGVINSIFVRDKITTDCDFHNTWNTTAKTMKISVDSETTLCHYNKLHSMSFPQAVDVKRSELGFGGTCGSSVRMATLQMV